MYHMSDAPTNIKLPPGMALVPTADGKFEVQSTAERRKITMSFRLSPAEHQFIVPFLQHFTSSSDAIRWLLNDDRVREVMSDRVRASSQSRGARVVQAVHAQLASE